MHRYAAPYANMLSIITKSAIIKVSKIDCSSRREQPLRNAVQYADVSGWVES
jgi:hypothetical protein